MKEVPVASLYEALSYDRETGVFMWLTRPKSHFLNEQAWRFFNTKFPGQVAGGRSGPYWKIRFTLYGVRRTWCGHRLAWAMMTGAWPTPEVDHENGNGFDNRWSNLREATRGEQQQNRKLSKANTSGYMGVSWAERVSKWQSQIKGGGRSHHLGFHDTPELAHAAYLEAKARLHLFQPIPRAA